MENLKEIARKNIPEFKEWEEKHQELDDLIDEMERKEYLTPEEELKLEELKKLRLHYKDLMQAALEKVKKEFKK